MSRKAIPLRLNPFKTIPSSYDCAEESFLKRLQENERFLVASNFSFVLQCFLPDVRTLAYCTNSKICCLQILSTQY